MNPDRVADLRRAYGAAGLAESDLQADPIAQFSQWFQDAVNAGLPEPNAMIVATATADGVPSVRTVLLKGFDAQGFVFFTNYESRKGIELSANPRAALLFPWHALERQVRIEGPVERVAREQTETYFHRRPRGSALGAWASPQSRVITGRADLERWRGEREAQFAGDPVVPAPDFWGGFRVRPTSVEFWQGRPDRLHDRLRLRRAGADWVLERLAP